MGKRSNFERIEKDFYRTIDDRAMEVLAPYLKPETAFIEPCAGAGDLIVQLCEYGHYCAEAWDIDPKADCVLQADALEHYANTAKVDCFITNPPWSRPILHKLIDHLSAQCPTWLLFDADWAYTTQEIVARKHGVKTVAELMKHCHAVIAVGRLRWIPGTKTNGKDNCAWYLFDQQQDTQTQFFARAAA